MTMDPDDPRVDIDQVKVSEARLRLEAPKGGPLKIAIRPTMGSGTSNRYRTRGTLYRGQGRGLPPGTVLIPAPYQRDEETGEYVGLDKTVDDIDVIWT
jgi:hypothetical protein